MTHRRHDVLATCLFLLVASACWLLVSSAARAQDKSAASQPAVPAKPVVLSHVANASTDMQSYGDTGFAEIFERPAEVDTVVAVEVYCSRYGTPQPPKEDFHVYLLDENQKVIKDVPVPYGRVNRGDMKWYAFPIPRVKVPEKFHVALSFNAHRTKGIYVGKDTTVKETHSFVGLPEKGYEPVDGTHDWMIRVRLVSGAKQPATAG